MSTLAAMSPILIKPSYLGMVFLKTVFLVTVFGLIHGLVRFRIPAGFTDMLQVILPIFLSFFGNLFKWQKVRSI